VRRAVCFYNWSGEGAGILAGPFALNDMSVTRIQVECRQVTTEVLDVLCSLPNAAAASGSAEVDTWPLIHGVVAIM
jgi:hypothetical protein